MKPASTVFLFKAVALISLFGCCCTNGDLLAQSAADSLQPRFEISATKYMLGTQIDFKAMCAEVLAGKLAFFKAFEEISRIENLLSSHKKGSDITNINQHAGVRAVKVSPETLAIIQRAVAYSKEFSGVFDVSIGPITELWGFNSDREVTLPESTQVSKLLPLVNYENIHIDAADTTIFLSQKGMRLDLGGIAKGYAIDRAAAVLKKNGLSRFLINAGGDIYASGYKTDRKKWVIGIQHPRKPQKLIATAEVHDRAVATSGDYERFTIIDGKRYCHIMNPDTGYPADRCQSVTVFAQTAEEADACATFLFVVGKDRQQSTCHGHPIESVIVDAGGTMVAEAGVRNAYALHPTKQPRQK